MLKRVLVEKQKDRAPQQTQNLIIYKADYWYKKKIQRGFENISNKISVQVRNVGTTHIQQNNQLLRKDNG